MIDAEKSGISSASFARLLLGDLRAMTPEYGLTLLMKDPEDGCPTARCVRWTPYPVIVTIMDNKDYIRVLLYSYDTTITGWGVLLRDASYVGGCYNYGPFLGTLNIKCRIIIGIQRGP